MMDDKELLGLDDQSSESEDEAGGQGEKPVETKGTDEKISYETLKAHGFKGGPSVLEISKTVS